MGVSFTELVTKIIEFAEIQQQQIKENIVSYDIDLLNKMGSSGKHK
jgi:DNA-directed RNA polymerase delta subunit